MHLQAFEPTFDNKVEDPDEDILIDKEWLEEMDWLDEMWAWHQELSDLAGRLAKAQQKVQKIQSRH